MEILPLSLNRFAFERVVKVASLLCRRCFALFLGRKTIIEQRNVESLQTQYKTKVVKKDACLFRYHAEMEYNCAIFN